MLLWLGQAGVLALIVLAATVWVTGSLFSLEYEKGLRRHSSTFPWTVANYPTRPQYVVHKEGFPLFLTKSIAIFDLASNRDVGRSIKDLTDLFVSQRLIGFSKLIENGPCSDSSEHWPFHALYPLDDDFCSSWLGTQINTFVMLGTVRNRCFTAEVECGDPTTIEKEDVKYKTVAYFWRNVSAYHSVRRAQANFRPLSAYKGIVLVFDGLPLTFGVQSVEPTNDYQEKRKTGSNIVEVSRLNVGVYPQSDVAGFLVIVIGYSGAYVLLVFGLFAIDDKAYLIGWTLCGCAAIFGISACLTACLNACPWAWNWAGLWAWVSSA